MRSHVNEAQQAADIMMTNVAISHFKLLKSETKQQDYMSASMISILNIINKTEKLINQEPDRMDVLCNDALFEICHDILSNASLHLHSRWNRLWHTKENENFYSKWCNKLSDYKPTILLSLNDDPLFLSKDEYVHRGIPLFELNKNQPVIDAKQLIDQVNHLPYYKVAAYIYVADKLTCKVRFSPTTTSAHINITDGLAASGAGEVYLQKTLDGIELLKLNNRSGLYLPGAGFMNSLKTWFSDFGIVTAHTLIEDERNKQIEDIVGMRWLGR